MKHSIRLGLGSALIGGAVLAGGCSGGSSAGGQAYALRGTPAAQSGVDSANFLITAASCKFVALVGYTSDASIYTFPCKVISDKPDALGEPHQHVAIDITTPKGVQHAKIDSTTTGMIASQSPDLGFPFPSSWAVAAPAPAVSLQSNDPNSSMNVTVTTQGVECTVTINSAPVNCGLSYWNDKSIALWVPGMLVSANYAGTVIGLTFANTANGEWTLARAPASFPTKYAETSATK